MCTDQIIEKWEEKHSSILAEYSKGNPNKEVMQMYRSQMKNILDFIEDIKQIKKIVNSDNTINIKTVKDSFSRDEFEKKIFLFNKWRKDVGDLGQNEPAIIVQWIEQNIL